MILTRSYGIRPGIGNNHPPGVMMKSVIRMTAALATITLSAPAWALGEYNDAIERACSGHSVEMIVPKEIIDGEKTISMHPDPDLGRRIAFQSDQRWLCRMRKGSMMFGSTVDGWGGSYRILPELNDDGAVIVLSPTTSPVPSN